MAERTQPIKGPVGNPSDEIDLQLTALAPCNSGPHFPCGRLRHYSPAQLVLLFL